MEHTRIKLCWWTNPKFGKNFGDLLSPYICKRLSGRSVKRYCGPGKLISIGSIFTRVYDGDLVWGTGIQFEHQRCNKRAKFLAVRGPLTWKRVLHKQKQKPAFGDPALLLPMLLKSNVPKEYEIGVLPHYIDFQRVLQEVKDKKVNVIDIFSGIENVIQEVNKCNFLYASSLHAVIVGEAYQIPTCWVKISDKIAGNDFKFKDYFVSTGRTGVQFVDWRNKIKFTDKTLPPRQWSEKQTQKLFRSFPYLRKELT